MTSCTSTTLVSSAFIIKSYTGIQNGGVLLLFFSLSLSRQKQQMRNQLQFSSILSKQCFVDIVVPMLCIYIKIRFPLTEQTLPCHQDNGQFVNRQSEPADSYFDVKKNPGIFFGKERFSTFCFKTLPLTLTVISTERVQPSLPCLLPGFPLRQLQFA